MVYVRKAVSVLRASNIATATLAHWTAVVSSRTRRASIHVLTMAAL